MSMVGYVTVAEADEYVRTHYFSNDELYQAWFALEESDKIVFLNRSFQLIELLPFTGRRLDPGQPNAFPRWPQQEVPEAIKCAQIENALAKSDASNEEDTKFYDRMRTFGIESYSIGNLSEKVVPGEAHATGIVSAIANRLLRPYLGGGYRM